MAGVKGKRSYSEELKRQIANEYNRGESNMVELQQKYGIASFASVHKWVHKYGDGTRAVGATQRGSYKAGEPSKKKVQAEYVQRMREKFMRGVETGIMPEFDTDSERLVYALFENQYLKKKLLDMGESKDSLASLWSSKNLADLLARFGLVDVSE